LQSPACSLIAGRAILPAEDEPAGVITAQRVYFGEERRRLTALSLEFVSRNSSLNEAKDLRFLLPLVSL